MGNIEGQEKDFLEAGRTALGIIVATLGSTVGMLLGHFARQREWNASALTPTR